MIEIRKGSERGYADRGWLQSHHSFSFADYHDPARMGYSVLRVINEDRIMPASGFPTHPHRDMEILTYVLAGALAHTDSMGNGSIIAAGEVQRMSAGTGVTHSEFNASTTEPVHLLQIWILPARRGLAPSYEQRRFPPTETRGRWRLLAAGDAVDGAVRIHQDVALYAAILGPDATVEYPLARGRRAWLQLAHGRAVLNGYSLLAGDGAAISNETPLVFRADEEAEALLFDLP